MCAYLKVSLGYRWRPVWRRVRRGVEAVQQDGGREDAEGGHDGPQGLPGGGMHHEGDETSEPRPVARSVSHWKHTP